MCVSVCLYVFLDGVCACFWEGCVCILERGVCMCVYVWGVRTFLITNLPGQLYIRPTSTFETAGLDLSQTALEDFSFLLLAR